MKTTMPASLAALLRHPRARWAGLAALAGGLGFVVVGDTPATGGDMAASEVAWSVAPPGAPDVAAAQSIFAASAVWASQPAPVVSADAPPPAPPRLLGIVQVGTAGGARTALGVFQLPDGRRERASVGVTLADGSRVDALADTRAVVVMSDGRRVELKLLDVPQAPAVP